MSPKPLSLGLLPALFFTCGLRPALAAEDDPTTDELEDSSYSDNADSEQPASESSDVTATSTSDEDDGATGSVKAASAKADVSVGESVASTGSAAEGPSSEGPSSSGTESPLTLHSGGWAVSMYGFAELDMMADTTQSFVEGSLSNTLARPNTVAGDNPRVQFTGRNSRLGFRITAPASDSIRASAVVEMDFFGTQPLTVTETDNYSTGPMRMRHYYAKLETPAVDVLAGQYHDLFAWGGAGFFPNTVAFLGVLGEVYHRDPQLRLSKIFGGDAIDLEIAAAAVRPVQRDAAAPDVQGGIRLAINGWQGASDPGASRPTAAPMAIGVSALGRRLSVTDFSATPGNPRTATAGGIAANVFLPVIPASEEGDLSNALSFTGEFTTGTGITDMYPGLTGGVGFPALPNPNNLLAVPLYTPNIDVGIATFDGDNELQTVDWQGLVLGAHYHFPFGQGKKLWLSGTFSMIHSANALEITPVQGRPFVWDDGKYFDVNVWWGVTSAMQVAVSGQHTEQTFGDGVVAKNDRAEGSVYFIF